MKNTLLTTLILFAFCINAFSQAQSAKKHFSEDNYSINYPSNWDLDDTGTNGTSFILFSPVESGQDNFRENVNLLIQDLSAYNLNLDKYVEISEGQIKTMLKYGKLLESKRMRKGPNEFHKLVYSGYQGTYALKFEQYCWLKNEKAYILTLTCESNQFDRYKKVGEEILNSFKFNF